MPCCSLWDRIQPWLRDYDRLQSLAVLLIYVQVACALIGSLGAMYNGVSLINLAIALFALVAIESSSQSLGRTYAVLLFCALLLDVSWFILFSHQIWNISSASYGRFFVFSVRLTLAMQILAFSVRFSSSLLWIQIYRLGATPPRDTDFDLRNSFLSPATPLVMPRSQQDDDAAAAGGSIYDPVYYSSLFEEGQDGLNLGPLENFSGNGSNSIAEVHQVKQPPGRSFQAVDVGAEEQVKQSPERSFHAIGAEDHLVKQSPGRLFHAVDVLENAIKNPRCV